MHRESKSDLRWWRKLDKMVAQTVGGRLSARSNNWVSWVAVSRICFRWCRCDCRRGWGRGWRRGSFECVRCWSMSAVLCCWCGGADRESLARRRTAPTNRSGPLFGRELLRSQQPRESSAHSPSFSFVAFFFLFLLFFIFFFFFFSVIIVFFLHCCQRRTWLGLSSLDEAGVFQVYSRLFEYNWHIIYF